MGRTHKKTKETRGRKMNMTNKVMVITLCIMVGLLALVTACTDQGGGANTNATATGANRNGSASNANASGGAGDANALSSADRDFMMKAAAGGMAEVELGRLASQKGASNDVKTFGKHMVDDHSKANDELKQLASQKGVTLPADMGAQHKETMDRLSKLNGAAFDSAYVSEMVKDHTEDVSDFERQSSQGQNSDVKAWAAKTLPTLRDHLQMIRDTETKMRGGRPANSNSGRPANANTGNSNRR
jgi:putative membrane protein